MTYRYGGRRGTARRFRLGRRHRSGTGPHRHRGGAKAGRAAFVLPREHSAGERANAWRFSPAAGDGGGRGIGVPIGRDGAVILIEGATIAGGIAVSQGDVQRIRVKASRNPATHGGGPRIAASRRGATSRFQAPRRAGAGRHPALATARKTRVRRAPPRPRTARAADRAAEVEVEDVRERREGLGTANRRRRRGAGPAPARDARDRARVRGNMRRTSGPRRRMTPSRRRRSEEAAPVRERPPERAQASDARRSGRPDQSA